MQGFDIFDLECIDVKVIHSKQRNSILPSPGISTSLWRCLVPTLTSKPKAYAFTKSAPFCNAPASFVALEVYDHVRNVESRMSKRERTRISTHRLCTFIRT